MNFLQLKEPKEIICLEIHLEKCTLVCGLSNQVILGSVQALKNSLIHLVSNGTCYIYWHTFFYCILLHYTSQSLFFTV